MTIEVCKLVIMSSLHSCDPVGCHACGSMVRSPRCRLQDISSGYWVLVLHFTRREAVRQIDELQHIATNLGRSEAYFLPVKHTDMHATWWVKHLSAFHELVLVVRRSCMVIPGFERELFRELPASFPWEPRIITKVLFQVSHLVILILINWWKGTSQTQMETLVHSVFAGFGFCAIF